MTIYDKNLGTVYLFDVDGTLTPARQRMQPAFRNYFAKFVSHHQVFLVSGSDYSKLCEQVPADILHECRGVFGCSGAEYLEQGTPVFTRHHEFPEELVSACEEYVQLSAYPHRCGTHIEHRPGVLNISSVGRDATIEQRNHYNEWDGIAEERTKFADWINTNMVGYEANVGGQISIDIVPDGWNKSSVIPEILGRVGDVRMIFFGDRICQGGNDMPLAEALQDLAGGHRSVAVQDDKATMAALRAIFNPKDTIAA